MKRVVLAIVIYSSIIGLLFLAWYDFNLLANQLQSQDFSFPRFFKTSLIPKTAAPGKNHVPLSRSKHPMETPATFAVRENRTRGLIDTDRYLLYLPEDVDGRKKFPLVFVMSPDGNAPTMVETWRKTADQFHWIIAASKEHRNGMPFSKIGPLLSQSILDILLSYPIDRSKVIASGFSGGGMGAHYLSMTYPHLIAAVVVNTCMIHEDFENGKGYRNHGNKLAVFLASPTDFRYDEMQRNRALLERFGWKTRWIEFQGGHTIAPDSVYHDAAQWLTEQFK